MNGRGKRSIALDLRLPDGQETLRNLCRVADIVVENFTPGTLERWGLGYDVLSEHNPGLILLRVSGFGQTGPYKSKRAFGRIAQSFSGFSSVTGFADGPPLHPGVPVGDYFGALTGIGAVLAAYIERERSGLGQEIDLALYEATFRIMELLVISYDQEGVIGGREGTSNTYVAPVGTWRSKDGKWFSLTASTQPVAERLLETMGGQELAADPRFASNSARVAHRDELEVLMANWIGGLTIAELVEICDANNVAYAIEYDIADIFEDPHYSARQTIESVPDPDVGTIRMCKVVPEFSRTPGAIRWPGESIGASTDEVLGDTAWTAAD